MSQLYPIVQIALALTFTLTAVACSGQDGEQGPPGDPGEPGEQGPSGMDGDGFDDESFDALISSLVDNSAFRERLAQELAEQYTEELRGPQGEQGESGPTGPQGPQGEQGLPGDASLEEIAQTLAENEDLRQNLVTILVAGWL